MKQTHYFFVLLFVYLCFSCKDIKKSKEKTIEKKEFNWGASVTGAKDYPIEVHTGYFATKKKFITGFSNSGVEDDGWQANGSDMGAGGRVIPTLVAITWVSYAEKKFWKLDEGVLNPEILLHYFQKGFYIKNRVTKKLEHQTYNHLSVAVAPGGIVAVFLTGDFHRVQVGRFQAKETIVTPNEFYDNPDNDTQQEFFDSLYDITLLPIKKEEIKAKGIPYGLWDAYETKFNWRVVPKFYKPDTFVDMYTLNFNGEEEYKYQAELDEKKYYTKPLPWQLDLTLGDQWYTGKFDWEELYAACKTVANGDTKAQIDIVAKVGFEYREVLFSVVCKDKVVPLTKVKGKVYGTD